VRPALQLSLMPPCATRSQSWPKEIYMAADEKQSTARSVSEPGLGSRSAILLPRANRARGRTRRSHNRAEPNPDKKAKNVDLNEQVSSGHYPEASGPGYLLVLGLDEAQFALVCFGFETNLKNRSGLRGQIGNATPLTSQPMPASPRHAVGQ
jgi:hypothetical protein